MKIYFPETSSCCGGHGQGPGSAHRFFQGANPGQSFAIFFKKMKKMKKVKKIEFRIRFQVKSKKNDQIEMSY